MHYVASNKRKYMPYNASPKCLSNGNSSITIFRVSTAPVISVVFIIIIVTFSPPLFELRSCIPSHIEFHRLPKQKATKMTDQIAPPTFFISSIRSGSGDPKIMTRVLPIPSAAQREQTGDLSKCITEVKGED